MSDRARRARAALMQLATELLTENEDLEHRLNEALELLDSMHCGGCMGTKIEPETGRTCAWCKSIDALRLQPDDKAWQEGF